MERGKKETGALPLLLGEASEPVEEDAVPENTVLGRENPVAFFGEVQEALVEQLLEQVERGDACRGPAVELQDGKVAALDPESPLPRWIQAGSCRSTRSRGTRGQRPPPPEAL